MMQRFYEKQGVVFSHGIWSILYDVKTLKRLRAENPTYFPLMKILEELFPKRRKPPPVVGLVSITGDIMLIINDVELLLDIFVKNRKNHTKHPIAAQVYGNTMAPKSIIFA
jgi:hypothetical protein